jgi:hypothetical protein
MRISLAVTLAACIGALTVSAPTSASSAPLVLSDQLAGSLQTGDAFVQKVRRRYRRGYYLPYYYPYYSPYYQPYYYYRLSSLLSVLPPLLSSLWILLLVSGRYGGCRSHRT